MTRQELIAKLKDYREYGYFLQVKLTATTSALQSEYDRIFTLDTRPSSFESVNSPLTEEEQEFVVNNPDGCPSNVESKFKNQTIQDTSAQDAIDYANDCANGICSVFELPVLPEDEIPFCDSLDSADVEEFRELLDNSLLNDQDALSVFDLTGYVKQTVTRIANLSRDWCLREARGFMSLFGSYTKLTTRTPRRVARRASRFIADIVKASKGLLHAQYTRGV